MPTSPNPVDQLVSAADATLRTLFARPVAARPTPRAAPTGALAKQRGLRPDDAALSGALMRVNHVGEVCAQALYTAQALTARNPAVAQQLRAAAQEETDHLAWTEQRLAELGARKSLLNPLWYAGAFGLGLVAGRLGGDQTSLAFVVETERQVEAHLDSHLDRLPSDDLASRAIVRAMRDDEARHAAEAQLAGAVELPAPVKLAMKAAAKMMTTVAHRI
jgi:ubiquinone biosynthesis monooxygenase Coq7